ncbi:hypothetical protein B0H14DRAFT_3462075 [Mycena olivaceomarginata]|nr:hypothetical protein B0H14DRAFT_3462075 [Mycena olivaceomarginata]
MDVWPLRIVADADAEAAASAQDIFATPEPPVQASWIAAKLDEPKDALQRGEIDREYYEHEHDELLEDEAEDQRLQAEGWAYDEERGDYWHPVHGWGEDYDPEEPANRLLPLLDSTANADDPPPFADMLSPPSDFPAAHDLATAIDQPPPLLHIAPDLDEPTHAELIVDEPVYIVPPHPMKHQQRKYRSSSAKPAPKNRRSAGRRSCSFPNFRREPTPHLVTPTPPAPEPGEPWVLQTSTDPVIITAAAEMAADLQWLISVDLAPQINRLRESLLACFEYREDFWFLYELEKIRDGMEPQAVRCGQAYCLLRAFNGFIHPLLKPDKFIAVNWAEPAIKVQMSSGVQAAYLIFPKALAYLT